MRPEMHSSLLLSLLMAAVFALAGGGTWLLVRGRERGKGVLMLVAALILFGNVLILTV